MPIAQLNAACEGAAWTVRVSAATWNYTCASHTNELLTLSACGPETAMKSIRALLVDPQAKPDFRLYWNDLDKDGEPESHSKQLAKPKRGSGKTTVGYVTKMARLDRGCYHLVAVSKLPGIILNISEDRLWEVLTGDGFSTPLLRSWMPNIMEKLKENCCLEVSEGFQAAVALLDVQPEGLDFLVSSCVKEGLLKLVA